MPHREKEVSYSTTNTYTVKNILSNSTKNIWLACHGMGYLSRFFINYFRSLDEAENYIIAPQAPSKYYQGSNFKYVGSSWLTKENTLLETENVLSYLDAIATAEQLVIHHDKLVAFGFSQGVSVALRWIASRKIPCKAIVIHSGGIPKELGTEDFSFLNKNTRVYLIYGTKDKYLNEERVTQETNQASKLFGSRLTAIPFDGYHKVNLEMISKISKEINQ